jgi:hypothetical protein
MTEATTATPATPPAPAKFHDPGTVLVLVLPDCELTLQPIPPLVGIGLRPETEALYAAEVAVAAAVRRAAMELAGVRGLHPVHEYWSLAVPAALAQALDSFEESIAVPAAIAYLQGRGVGVVLPESGAGEAAP